VTDAGLAAYTPSEYRARLADEVDDAARSGHVSARLQERWREQLGRDAWWVFTPVPIHGDMAAEHLLENGDRISAITDFASVQVSDPAEDLAQILAPLPPDVAASIIGAYRRRRGELDDQHLEDRAAFLGEIAIIRWLRHGIALDDAAIVADARDMLADLDRAVEAEQAEAARAAQAEAAAAAKLEAAKRAAEAEARERRQAVERASQAAARERLRTSGSLPRVGDDTDAVAEPEAAGPDGGSSRSDAALPEPDAAWRGPDAAGRKGDAASPGPDAEPADRTPGPPKRKSVAKTGVSLWGRPKKTSPKPDDFAALDLLGEVSGPEPGPGPGAAGRAGDDAADKTGDRVDGKGDTKTGRKADGKAAGNLAGPAGDLAGPAGDLAGPAGVPVGSTAGRADGLTGSGPAAGPGGPATDRPDGKAGTSLGVEPADRDADRPGAEADDRPDVDKPDSGELTQAFLPDFLKDESEAPDNIAAAAAQDETEALERPRRPKPPI
jgi:hypothetical protein